MFWIGYDAPDNLPWDEGWDAAGVRHRGAWRRDGGERLADTLDGLRASRDGDPAHLTAIGHSYGSTTTGHAAHDHGIPVDDLVFVGSPGVGGDTNNAGDTGVDPDHVWAGANSRDPIANLGNHGWIHGETVFGAGLGDDPAEDDFGANRFQAESTTRADDASGSTPSTTTRSTSTTTPSRSTTSARSSTATTTPSSTPTTSTTRGTTARRTRSSTATRRSDTDEATP